METKPEVERLEAVMADGAGLDVTGSELLSQNYHCACPSHSIKLQRKILQMLNEKSSYYLGRFRGTSNDVIDYF